MAQLIKLEDYISRYEWNVYRYPSQFIRMKQDNWKKLRYQWMDEITAQQTERSQQNAAFSSWKTFFKRRSRQPEPDTSHEETNSLTEKQLRQYFLDKVFPLQLKWATSTITDVSFMKQSYDHDMILKYFLQRFPDTYLIMYYPIFNIKKAPVDGEIIMIGPIGIDIIYLLEQDTGTTIIADDDRTWSTVGNKANNKTKILSPVLTLKRTEQIIKSILHKESDTFPVNKVVLSRTNTITDQLEPFNTNIVGKKEYDNWFAEKRKLISPLKNRQLKAAALLLKHCQTTSVKRPEWEEDNHSFSMGENEDN
ncbi:NERD domain-containing protein [Lentibacillus cibarius]|uniref:NERD domain-containing protein n=1 Tax=Lentibacillus cibarius TaxID=2583219 RepID=A0A549YM99_9BACI|nr:NERD domain-containing protein [Lentibacillus cibarius]TRM12994.1 NERD domain-containing protein [Lentibacillus cibarius]